MNGWVPSDWTMREIAKAYAWYRDGGDNEDSAMEKAIRVIGEKSVSVKYMSKPTKSKNPERLEARQKFLRDVEAIKAGSFSP